MISRATLLAGPGYVTFGGSSFRMASNMKLELVWETDNVVDALKGPFTKVVKNRYLRLTGTPLYYDPTNTTATFFPYISLLATPPGTQIFGTSDATCTIVANSGLTFVMAAAAVTKMPEIFAGADKAFYGALEIIGICKSGSDFGTASNFYTESTSNAFTPPAIPGSATLARQKWSAAYGSDSGWSAFQSYDGFSISHELGLKWATDNGQYIGAWLTGYRAMCKCTPSGNTIAQLLTEMVFAGTNPGATVTASQGQRLDAQQHDLILSGAVSGTITLKNASIEVSDINFGADVLHQGQVGFITNVGDNSGANVASLVLA